jgi:hypothetical protein
MNRLPAMVVYLPLIFVYCSPSLMLQLPDQRKPPLLSSVNNRFERGPFRGSGSLFLVAGGEKQSGNFDVRYNADRSFIATFYSPLGTIIGSITAGDDSGVVTLPDTTFRQPLDKPLGSVLLPWGDNLTLGTVVAAMRGIPADTFPAEYTVEKAETARNCREFVFQNKTIEYAVIFSGNLKKLKRIVIAIGKVEPSRNAYSVTYENFLNGMARLITIKTGDRNYFSLHYEKVLRVPQED